MGIKERKERDKMMMRRRILDSAIELFVEQGYENVQIRKITDRIEYSPGTFYLYFKDKDEVFFYLHEEGFADLYKRFMDAKNVSDSRERLQKLGETFIDFALEKPHYYEIMFIMRSPMKQEMNSEWKSGSETFKILLDTVNSCMIDGHFKSQDAYLTSMMMLSMVHGFVSLIIRDRIKNLNDDQLKEMIRGYKEHLRVMILERS